jgi:hypothetical protein
VTEGAGAQTRDIGRMSHRAAWLAWSMWTLSLLFVVFNGGVLGSPNLLPTLFLVATMLFLLFPNGRLLSAEWRFVAWVAVIGGVMTTLGGAFGVEDTGTLYGGYIHNPVEISNVMGEVLRTLQEFGLVLLLLCFLASITSLFARWVRRGGRSVNNSSGSLTPLL